MYRYNNDNAVTYTPDDLDLFRESPFALWMERLTLENPDHGIFPDVDSSAPADRGAAPIAVAETLRAEGKQVAHINPDHDEPDRREATIAAMHEGADFIAGGQLAVGAFSAGSQLLMRTSGYTRLGDFLYIPCEAETSDTFHSGFRLAFLAHLLESIQGQLPPQMLIIRDGSDVVSLQTEDHILYFRSVFERFEQAMGSFRKHRMPDPAESSHFGRWSDCASEVLKQRAQSEQARSEEDAEAEEAREQAQELEVAPLLVAGGAAAPQEAVARSVPSTAWWNVDDGPVTVAGVIRSPRAEAGPTLAEQARMLEPGSFQPGQGPGHTPNLSRFPSPAKEQPVVEPAEAPVSGESAAGMIVREIESPSSELPTDATLENLEFIRSRSQPLTEPPEDDDSASAAGLRAGVPDEPLQLDESLRLDETLELDESLQLPEPGILDEAGREIDVPRFLPPEPALNEPESEADEDEQPTLTAERPAYTPPPLVDLDSAPAPTLAPVRNSREEPEDEEPPTRNYDIGIPAYRDDKDEPDAGESARPFDDRLNTSADFDDD